MNQEQNKSLSLTEFVSKLVEAKNFTGLDKDVMDQIKADLMDRVEDRINAVILEHMPPEKLEYFKNLLDRADEKEIQLFCRRNIPNLETIIASELASFRDTYLRG